MILPECPSWVPYRIKSRWNEYRVNKAIAAVLHTDAAPCADPKSALADLHMLVCKRDLRIAIVALKSLLRYLDQSVAISLTNDGSLSDGDEKYVAYHIPGCRWIRRDALEHGKSSALHEYHRLRNLYNGPYQPIRKYLHPILLSACDRVIVLDPDTAFFRRPDRLITWIMEREEAALFVHDHQVEDVEVPEVTREVFQQLRQALGISEADWNMPYYFFNSGLLAYQPAKMSLSIAEMYLEWLETAPDKYTTGKPGLWFGSWTPEQTIYQVSFAALGSESQPLGDQYRLGSIEGYTFNHFLWFQLSRSKNLRRLQRLVDELDESKSPKQLPSDEALMA